MKVKSAFLSAVLVMAGFTQLCYGNIVGYVNITFQPGDTLFANPYDKGNGNLLSSVIPSPPHRTTVSVWDSVSNAYTQIAVFYSSSNTWSDDLELAPGQGFELHTSTAFDNTFVGDVLAPDGSPWTKQTPLPLPTFTDPPGVYLLSSRFPAYLPSTNDGLTVFKAILGRDPYNGEQFTWLDPETQQSHTTTFINGTWNNGEPTLAIGQAAFFKVSLAPLYGGGSGTPADPYLIYTAQQMNTIGLHIEDWGSHFKLMADIDMSAYTGTQYNIIGNPTTEFAGTFDGNGNVISNLTYTTIDVLDNVGLFGWIKNATIKNLGVKNVSLSTGGNHIGGLVGLDWDSSLTACYATGSVHGQDSVGGLAGVNLGSSLGDCYAVCSISSTRDYAGGLAGYNDTSTLTDCYAAGSVSGTGLYVGGFVGYNITSTLANCFWNIQTSNQAVGVGVGTSAGVTGKTTAKMQLLVTFTDADWDFVNVWGIGQNQTYPYLRTQPSADLNGDNMVNLDDFTIFAAQWLEGV